VDFVVRKHDTAILCAIEQSGLQQQVDVAMHGARVTAESPRDLTDAERALALTCRVIFGPSEA